MNTESFECIYGENESGKTTLQNFILFILFGLPPKQREFYRPKKSGKMGGMLILSDSEVGDYQVERIDEVQNGAAICRTSDGLEHDELWLKKRLKDMTIGAYQSIFSFSSLDLKDFKEMKDEELGEVILGIGVTGSNTIYTLEKRLENEMGALFKPFGKKPIINKQFIELNQLNKELKEFQKNESTYQDKQNKSMNIVSEINQLKNNLTTEKQNQFNLERKINNFEIISNYHAYHKELEIYGSKVVFPESGIKRLNYLKDKKLPIESELIVLNRNMEEQEEEKRSIENKLLEEDFYDLLEEFINNKESYVNYKKNFDFVNDEVKRLNYKLDNELKELNLDFTFNELENISVPFYVEKTWNDLKNQIEKLKITTDKLTEDHTTLKKQKKFIEEEIEKASLYVLNQKDLSFLYEKIDSYKEYEFLNKINQDTNSKQYEWTEKKEKKNKNISILFITSFIASLVIGMIGFIIDLPLLYNLTVLIFLFGLGQWLFGKHSIKEMSELIMSKKKVNPHTNRVTKEDKEQAEEKIEEHDKYRAIIVSLNNQLKSNDIELIKWKEKNNAYEHQKEIIVENVNEQIREYPFLKQLKTSYWPEFYFTLKRLIEENQIKKIKQEEKEHIKNRLFNYQEKINHLLKRSIEDPLQLSMEAKIENVEKMISEHKNNRQLLLQIVDSIINIGVKKETFLETKKIYDHEIKELLALAKVENENDFYQKAKDLENRQNLLEKINENERQLKTIFNPKDAAELIRNKPDQSNLELRLEESHSKLKQYDIKIDNLRNELARLSAEINAMESSESYSNTMHLFNMKEEELNELVREWSELKVAFEMLAETKRRYRDKYLEKVIKKTSQYFKYITDSKYTRVFSPVEGSAFQVETNDNVRYHIGELSEGTLDQLYICLRIAISEIMSKDHDIPFIIDDAFIHFDEKRTQRMLNILIEISKNQQIIFFTCKKEMLKWIPRSSVIRLVN